MKTWVFSARADIILFLLLPFFISLLNWATLPRDWVLFLVYLAFYLDIFHVYLTAVPLVADPLGDRRTYFIKGFIISSVAFLLFLTFGIYSQATGKSFQVVTGQLLNYGAIWHFYRQQYGWMRISSKKDSKTYNLNNSMDSSLIFVITIFPVLISHAPMLAEKTWFTGVPYAFELNDKVGLSLLILYWTTIFTYIISQIFFKKIGKINYNWPKYIVIFSTFFCWYMSFMSSLKSGGIGYIIFIHAIPYFYLVITNIKNGFNQGFRITLLTLVGIALAFLFMQSARFYFPETRYKFGPFLPIDLRWVPEHAQLVLWCLLLTPVLAHYLLDGFVWKRRKIGVQP